ncbi:MAG: cation:dicarboxylase symporter family transporter [Terrimicrobiaceae bacterium]|nr:cation:dicarboxylase symporter family transporter [Terrimicrobiaceae bacterium]
MRISLTAQILIGLVAGCLLGWLKPDWAGHLDVVRDIFLHLIKCLIAPLIFGSIVQGIAGTGDLKKVGRIGAKTLLYFELATTAALAVGLTVVNLLKPGHGVVLAGNVASLGAAVESKPLTVAETILHSFPTGVIDAMARGDVLQIVVFSVLFALAVAHASEAGKPILIWCGSLTEVMFKFAGIVMKFAPYGVGAAMAVTVSQQGLGVLLSLGKLVFTLYFALAIFVVFVFGAIIWITRIPLKPFVRAVREPFTIAFATANSEAALPKAFALMERFGVPPGIVGFVLPAGYTFNLDGSTLHLAVASVFIAQAAESTTGVHFGIGQQIVMMLTLMLTSKGVAAVPRASLVVLIAALHSFGLPLEGAAMILGVDALLDMARTSVNVLGNCLASVVIAKWEGEFDQAKALVEFGDVRAKGPPLPADDPAA